MPSIGDLAPDIDVETAEGNRFVLSEQRGRWVVIFFYVRANTPG
jgi:peroxiredoxin